MAKNRITIKTKDEDGNDLTAFVVRPSDSDYREAQTVASQVFQNAVKNGAILREGLEEEMKKQGIWSDEQNDRVEELIDGIQENLLKLKKGGIPLTEARKAAIKIRQDRLEQTRLLAKKRQLDEYTVEGQSENARFDHLVYLCTRDEDNEKIFKDLDDYRARSSEQVAVDAASELASILYGLDDNWEQELPENKFLKKFNFVNEDLRLVNKDGHLVTVDGKLIDEEGFFVDEDGNKVDNDGNLVDEDGLPIAEHAPFLDDDGNPITEDEEEEAEVTAQK